MVNGYFRAIGILMVVMAGLAAAYFIYEAAVWFEVEKNITDTPTLQQTAGTLGGPRN